MTTDIPFKILSIGGEGYHLMAKIYINRKVSNVIIDTGASTTVFDKKRILKYVDTKKFDKHDNLSSGLGTNTMQSHFTEIKNMKIGNLKLAAYKTVLLDLSHVNKSYEQAKLTPIDGVLGGDILFKYNAVIDYSKKSLRLKIK
ncbi:MAG: aspartyl protease family protein [Bacteroidota bacterium]